MLNFGNKEFRNLQEQVLENAKNIEILKERPGLKPVVVNELPAVGEVNILYLVPKNPDPDTSDADSYDEYVWLPETQTYEFVGSTALNLSNMVTTDTEQTITGAKTFNAIANFNSGLNATNDITTSAVQFGDNIHTRINLYGNSGSLFLQSNTGDIRTNSRIRPTTLTCDLADANYPWRRLYLGDFIKFSSGPSIKQDSSNRIVITGDNGVDRIKIGGETSTYCAASWTPDQNATYDLGTNGLKWKDLYLTGSISDGSNTVSVANIASKVTSTFISGIFDTNGESTIDTEQAGTPEGLFIFTYGNCQCFLRLTAAMVQNADTTPIRVACPMIYNSAAVNGWLNITKAGTILVLKVTDGTNHVDSGFAWTLTKTNLI